MKKIILGSIGLVVIAGMAVVALLWFHQPQIIKLSDGTTLTLAGVTYGKHHVAPKIKLATGRTRAGGARIDSTNSTVVVWIMAEHKANQYPNYQLIVYDTANTACSTSGSQTQSQVNNGTDIMGYRLDAFPRRDSKMILRVMSYGQRGQQVSKEQFVVSNPAGRSFANWVAEPIPDTQSDGDLSVTLTKLVAGVQSPYSRGNGVGRNDALNKGVELDFDFQQKGQSVTNWRPVRVVTSDATGNSLPGWINGSYQNGQTSGYQYQQGLWPDEPAWKLRVEFSRASGFSDDEAWSVTNVPVQPGTQQDAQNAWNNNWNSAGKSKPAFAETTVNGIHLKLFPAIQYQDQNNNGAQTVSFSLKADPDPEASGLRLTVLKVVDNQGHILQNRGAGWGGGNYQYQYSGVRNLQTLDLTFAIHKSRFIEFTVKPGKQ